MTRRDPFRRQAWVCLAVVFASTLLHGQGPPAVTVPAGSARIRERGNMRDDGTFSFWTRGVLGDWFVAPQAGTITVSVSAGGKAIGGVCPALGVEMAVADGVWRQVGRLPIASSSRQWHRLHVRAPAGFFGVRLRHLNRVADKNKKALRHLMLKELRVNGAVRSD